MEMEDEVSSSRTQMSDYVNRHNTGVLLLCEEGDLLEFPRGAISHWGVYVGDEKVIHRTGDKANGGKKNGKAEIREDLFWDVVGDSLARINNYLDKERDPLPGAKIVERARGKLGDVGYNLLSKNCEHFVTWCRYGVGISHQVKTVSNRVQAWLASAIASGLSLVGVSRSISQ